MSFDEEIEMTKEEIEMRKDHSGEIEMKKDRNDGGVDRMSALPDSLLIHMLCFLSEPAGFCDRWTEDRWTELFCRKSEKVADMRKIVVTSVLSQRWRYLWAELPELSFRERSMDKDEISKFVARVNRTLAIRNSKYLEKFYLEFGFSQKWAVFVDQWLEFVSKNKAKVVSLVLLPRENTAEYSLPQVFYGNSSLTELELEYCSVAPQRRIEWRCLTRLEFSKVELWEDVIENILSGCPALDSVGLHYCWGFDSLNINSPSVDKLGVWDGSLEESVLEISAPNIHYLEIFSESRVRSRKIRVRNIPSVVKARIDIWVTQGFEVEEERSDAKEWIEATLHILELRLSAHLITSVSRMVANGWQIPQSKRVSLFLEAGDVSDEDRIVAMISLLDSSPQLEKFKVFIAVLIICDPLNHQNLRNDDFSCCDYSNLKTVEIEFATGGNDDDPIDVDIILLLARILLRRATALEKMMILWHDNDDRPEFLKIVNEVKTYPKSSKQAQVMILSGSQWTQ